MRDIVLGLLGGLMGTAIFGGVTILFVAGEGIGPGDTLSLVGHIVPGMCAAAVLALFVRASGRRFLAASTPWLLLLVTSLVQNFGRGTGRDEDMLEAAIAALAMHLPAGACVLVNRLRDRDASDPASAS
tara:strand:+ start:3753 stop:4139 length:387 start_codon:yes stop_codon:yes gene_type:complete